MRSCPSRHVLLAAALAASSAMAQTSSVTLPASAGAAELAGSFGVGFDAQPFRYQQSWRLAEIAPTTGTINSIAFRADAGRRFAGQAFPGTTLQSVTIRLSIGPLPSGLSDRFDDNLMLPPTFCGAPQLVFSGSIQLPPRPALPVGSTAPASWITVPLSTPYTFSTLNTCGTGLIMDMTGVGAGPGGPNGGSYPLDAASTLSSAGSVRPLGISTGFDITNVLPRVMPGERVIAEACGSAQLALLSTRRLPQAIDLGAIGAPGQLLYLPAGIALPLADIRRFNSGPSAGGGVFCRRATQAGFMLPDSSSIEGVRFWIQMFAVQPTPTLTLGATNLLEYEVGFRASYSSKCIFGPATAAVATDTPSVAPVVRFVGQMQ